MQSDEAINTGEEEEGQESERGASARPEQPGSSTPEQPTEPTATDGGTATSEVCPFGMLSFHLSYTIRTFQPHTFSAMLDAVEMEPIVLSATSTQMDAANLLARGLDEPLEKRQRTGEAH